MPATFTRHKSTPIDVGAKLLYYLTTVFTTVQVKFSLADSLPNVTNVLLSNPGGVVWKRATDGNRYIADFHFNCSFHYINISGDDDGSRFQVSFLSTDSNGQARSVHSEILSSSQTVACLQGNKLRGFLGTHVN